MQLDHQLQETTILGGLRTFFNHINLLPNGTMEERCNVFASNGARDPNWAFHCIVRFLQFQRKRVEREEITGATLRNYVKAIKLFLRDGGCFDCMEKNHSWSSKKQKIR